MIVRIYRLKWSIVRENSHHLLKGVEEMLCLLPRETYLGIKPFVSSEHRVKWRPALRGRSRAEE